MPRRIGPGRGQRPTWLDAVLLAALLGLAAWLGHSVATGFTYHWHWDRLLGYLVRTGPEGGWQANYLLLGLATTLRLALWGIVLASMLGLLLGLAGFARRHSLRTLARLYVGLMRNVPPVVFLFVFYFFVSSQLMPWLGIATHVRRAGPAELTLLRWLFGDPALLENFLTGLVCLVLLEAAYITEIVRAGLEAVPKGQWEAGRSLGLGGWRLMRLVVLPQALRIIAPALAGQFISLVKDSSIVSLISVQELTFAATEVAVSSGLIYETWIAVASFYFLVCFPLSLLLRRYEAGTGTG